MKGLVAKKGIMKVFNDKNGTFMKGYVDEKECILKSFADS